jgi:hypothetical protein
MTRFIDFDFRNSNAFEHVPDAKSSVLAMDEKDILPPARTPLSNPCRYSVISKFAHEFGKSAGFSNLGKSKEPPQQHDLSTIYDRMQPLITRNVKRPNRWHTQTSTERLHDSGHVYIPRRIPIAPLMSPLSILPVKKSVQATKPKEELKIENLVPVSTRSNYYTEPDLATFATYSEKQLMNVFLFTIGHSNYGQVIWYGHTNVCRIDIDRVVTFYHRKVEFHPAISEYGLKRPVIVRLYDVWPKAKSDHVAIVSELDAFEQRLVTYCNTNHATHLGYNRSIGEWVFRMEFD